MTYHTTSIPLLFSPLQAILLLLALFVLPLLALFLPLDLHRLRYYMFRHLGLGLAWNHGNPTTGRNSSGSWSANGSTKERDPSADETSSVASSGDRRRKLKKKSHRKSHSGDPDSKLFNTEFYPGLVNISGTFCFLNSVLQSLASLSYLQPYLHTLQTRAEELDTPTPVIDALYDALIALNTPRNVPTSLKPSGLIAALSAPPDNSPSDSIAGLGALMKPRTKNPTSDLFSSREHQDAQELFQLLTEHVKDEASEVDRESRLRCGGVGLGALGLGLGSSGQGKKQLSSSQMRHRHHSTLSSLKTQFSKSPFDGLTANRRSCVECGYTEAVMHFAFNCWSLSVPRVHTLRLEDCLADYTRLELLNDCMCRKCSLVATHGRLKADIERLSGLGLNANGDTKGNEKSKERGKEKSKARKVKSNGDHVNEEGKEELSTSKKKRLREAKKAEAKVRAMLEEGRIEDDLPVLGSGVKSSDLKLERVFSKCSTRQSMIARPPPILAIHLNRSLAYGTYVGKNPAHVIFPEILDLTPFTTSGQLSTRPEAPISSHPPPLQRSITPTPDRMRRAEERVVYRLEAVVCHYGTHGFGHYVCYRRRPPGDVTVNGSMKSGKWAPPKLRHILGCECEKCTEEGPVLDPEEEEAKVHANGEEQKTRRRSRSSGSWLRISDAQVSYHSFEDVQAETSGAFMLFYERVLPPSAHPYSYGSLESMSSSEIVKVDGRLSNGIAHMNGDANHVAGAGLVMLRRSPSMSSQETVRPSPTHPPSIYVDEGSESGTGAKKVKLPNGVVRLSKLTSEEEGDGQNDLLDVDGRETDSLISSPSSSMTSSSLLSESPTPPQTPPRSSIDLLKDANVPLQLNGDGGVPFDSSTLHGSKHTVFHIADTLPSPPLTGSRDTATSNVLLNDFGRHPTHDQPRQATSTPTSPHSISSTSPAPSVRSRQTQPASAQASTGPQDAKSPTPLPPVRVVGLRA